MRRFTTIYFHASIATFALLCCTDCAPAIIIAALNAVNAIRMGYKHIPNFGEQD